MAWWEAVPVQWAVQSTLHSVIALFVVTAALTLSSSDDAAARFRYRVLVLLLPPLLYPIFQLVAPERSGVYFRYDDALFDSTRWFHVELWGLVSVGALGFGIMVTGATALTLIQEVVPVLRHVASKTARPAAGRRAGILVAAPRHLEQTVEELSHAMEVPPPELAIYDSDAPVSFTEGTRDQRIIISRGLTEMLPKPQLRAVLAHEVAHVRRRSNLTTLLIFLLRAAMFFNPISMISFRHMVQDDEQLCDDLTLQLIGDPRALSQALRAFYVGTAHARGAFDASLLEAVESHSHDLQLRQRIERLENLTPRRPFGWPPYLATIAVVVVLCYFVV